MSTETVAAKMGAGRFALPLEETCIRFRIKSVNEKCHYLANCYVESAGFSKTTENLNYSVEALLKLFGRHRISEADARKYGRSSEHPADQPMIANCIYGGRWGADNLGNTEQGDGWKYIGRGLIQLTGRANYMHYSGEVYGDRRCEADPQLLAYPHDAALSAGWFFSQRVPKNLAEGADVEKVRRKINGGTNGLDEVKHQYAAAQELFADMVQKR